MKIKTSISHFGSLAALCVAGVLQINPAQAITANAVFKLNQPAILPANTISCITRKDAQLFSAYRHAAPAFAADLLNRASCYQSGSAEPAILTAVEQGYVRLRLLSGHSVWLPQQQLK